MWLLSAFSVQMLPELSGTVRFSSLTLEEARERLARGFASAVGHEGTAEILSQRLSLSVPYERRNVLLGPGDRAVLAQIRLPRLAEGQVLTSAEIADRPISFVLIEILSD